MKIKPVHITLLVSVVWGSNVHASMSSSLDSFYNDLGYNTNVTNPSVYKGQTANYYSAGGLYVRNKIKNAQLVSLTLPDISMGCGGIDAFMGSFSHINSDELVSFGKSVISNAVPFVVDLALQTWAPQIKQIRDNLQAIADKFLNQSINSCETAQAAVSGIAGAFGDAQTKKHVCATMGTQNNAFADWVSAQNECGVGGQSTSQLNAAGNNTALAPVAKTSFNIVWDSIMKNNFLSSDKDLAQFLMSLSGTYVYDASGKPTYYPSLLEDNNNLVNALLDGGEVDYYKCSSTTKCLSLSESKLTLPESKGLNTRVTALLEAYYQNLVNDTVLTDSQKSFLEYSKIPVFSYIRDDIANNETPDFVNYARYTSVQLINTYLVNMLNVVNRSLANTSIDPTDVQLITESISGAKKFTVGLNEDALNRMIAYETLKNQKRHKQQIRKQAISQKNLSNYGFSL